ncbi:MAG: ABC transporter substrate-binding protein [Rhodospirillaceae bacterium]|nr:ABC transporter substrate-binding protein [Rhodospirillaceae bacterium]
MPAIDAGAPVTVLAGIHPGCWELIARDGVGSIMELRGGRIGVDDLTSEPPVLLTVMARYVGLDPLLDFEWVRHPQASSKELFIAGAIDAFMGFAPEPQELRARGIGHTILSTTLDRLWSQYFCCMLAGRSDYVDRHPIATKRVLRAVLKAADLCGSAPERMARRMVDGGFVDRYDFATASPQPPI